MEIRANIAETVRRVMEERGKTLSELSAELDIPLSSMNRYDRYVGVEIGSHPSRTDFTAAIWLGRGRDRCSCGPGIWQLDTGETIPGDRAIFKTGRFVFPRYCGKWIKR